MRKFISRPVSLLLISMLLLIIESIAQDLKPLEIRDYAKWEYLGGGDLSDDGKWLIYSIRRNDDSGELRLHNLTNNNIRILEAASGQRFSGNNKWLGFLIGLPPEEKKKLEKSSTPIRNKWGLINLATGDSTGIEDVSSFSFSDDGKFVAIRRYSPKGSKTPGTVLMIRNLENGEDFSFGNVTEYSWQDEGTRMAMIIDTGEKSGNGVQLFDGISGTNRLLDSNEAWYTGLSWRDESSDLAVYRSFTSENRADSSHHVIAWKNLSTKLEKKVFDQAVFSNFGTEKRIVSNRPLRWSKDGGRLFFETISWTEKVKEENNSEEEAENDSLFEEAPALQIWHSKDLRVIPEQIQLADRKDEDTHLATWNLINNSFTQLGDDLTENTRFDESINVILGFDATPYEFDGMFGRSISDAYIITLSDGNKKKILDGVDYVYSISPNGSKLAYLKDDQFLVYDINSGTSNALTVELEDSFVNLDDDHPVSQKPPYGFVGWDKTGVSFLVHSKYDVWQLFANGSTPENLTKGKSENIVSRMLIPDREEDYIDLTKPIYLSRYGEWTKEAGFARMEHGKAPRNYSWEDAWASRFIKAKDSETIAFSMENYQDSPDFYVVSGGKSKPKQVSSTNPFQKEYLWGKSELIEYTNANGRKLQGSLFYPDNYQPGEKYPMITYIYELRSRFIHLYEVPSRRDYYNHRVFTSNGYFVLQPDIVFDYGDPGISSVKTMEIAVKTVVEKGLVDSERVGLVGHSWGGYQSAFAVTNTDIFSAAVAGAGLTNLVSMYGMIAWSFGGTPENYHFEVSQERMEVPPYKDTGRYVRNSPVFNVDKINTPLLFEVGDADKNVDWRQGIEMYNAVRRAGKQMVLLVYANEGHGLREDKNRYDYQNRILQWFGFYLKGDPAADWIEEGIPYTEQIKRLKDWKK